MWPWPSRTQYSSPHPTTSHSLPSPVPSSPRPGAHSLFYVMPAPQAPARPHPKLTAKFKSTIAPSQAPTYPAHPQDKGFWPKFTLTILKIDKPCENQLDPFSRPSNNGIYYCIFENPNFASQPHIVMARLSSGTSRPLLS